jgi:hypothetical protein
MRQVPATDGRLQVKTKEWNHLRNRPAMREQLALAGLTQRSETEQAGLVIKFADEVRFPDCLPGGAADTGDPDRTAALGASLAISRNGGESAKFSA